ncbi:hypothetical protein GCM10023332_02860 [Luteimonas vadosa]|uniref:Beta-lactamase-related domain-containing protein n=2 Tax=Luteimonas vadosa TaxID=1165507 RepID=A0ABP9DQ16_9GAMM
MPPQALPPQLPRLGLLLLLALLLMLPVKASAAQGGPPPALRDAISAVEAMLGGTDEASLSAFAEQRLAPAYRARLGEGATAHLRALREAAREALGDVAVEMEEDGLHLVISDTRFADYRLAIDDAGLLTALELVKSGVAVVPAAPALTWESLPGALREAEARGFSGVVSATRDGRPVLRQAYGLADRERRRATKLDTIYGIGSAPIDFTVTATYLLVQRGRLSLDDRIGKFIPGVPADRSAMTIGHLLGGRSGLPDFPAQESDWDADLAWIDRDTFVARVMAQPLLFAPGTASAHSHGAYGLLAAIIELATGERYRDFIQREILDVAGMRRTGFYGDRKEFSLDDFAVGYGPSSVGLPNIPPNWGPTSWLVMGSGGMYSTLEDMQRFHDAISAGRILRDPWRAEQAGPRVGVDGSDRGYHHFHAFDGKGNRIELLMNGEGRTEQMRALQRAMEQLVEPPPRGGP